VRFILYLPFNNAVEEHDSPRLFWNYWGFHEPRDSLAATSKRVATLWKHGSAAVPHSEWQKHWAPVFVISVNATKNKHSTYKVGESFAIDCTTRFDKKSEVYFYRRR